MKLSKEIQDPDFLNVFTPPAEPESQTALHPGSQTLSLPTTHDGHDHWGPHAFQSGPLQYSPLCMWLRGPQQELSSPVALLDVLFQRSQALGRLLSPPWKVSDLLTDCPSPGERQEDPTAKK